MLYLPVSQKVIFVQILTSALFVDFIYDAKKKWGVYQYKEFKFYALKFQFMNKLWFVCLKTKQQPGFHWFSDFW